MLDISLGIGLDPLPDLRDSSGSAIPVFTFVAQGASLVSDERVQVVLPKSQVSLENLVATVLDRLAYLPTRTSKEAP